MDLNTSRIRLGGQAKIVDWEGLGCDRGEHRGLTRWHDGLDDIGIRCAEGLGLDVPFVVNVGVTVDAALVALVGLLLAWCCWGRPLGLCLAACLVVWRGQTLPASGQQRESGRDRSDCL
jgi:hypothetical protein